MYCPQPTLSTPLWPGYPQHKWVTSLCPHTHTVYNCLPNWSSAKVWIFVFRVLVSQILKLFPFWKTQSIDTTITFTSSWLESNGYREQQQLLINKKNRICWKLRCIDCRSWAREYYCSGNIRKCVWRVVYRLQSAASWNSVSLSCKFTQCDQDHRPKRQFPKHEGCHHQALNNNYASLLWPSTPTPTKIGASLRLPNPSNLFRKVKPNIHTKKLLLGFQKLQFYGYFVAHSSVN